MAPAVPQLEQCPFGHHQRVALVRCVKRVEQGLILRHQHEFRCGAARVDAQPGSDRLTGLRLIGDPLGEGVVLLKGGSLLLTPKEGRSAVSMAAVLGVQPLQLVQQRADLCLAIGSVKESPKGQRCTTGHHQFRTLGNENLAVR